MSALAGLLRRIRARDWLQRQARTTDQRPDGLRPGQDPLGQAELPPRPDQLRAEPHEQAKQHPGRDGADTRPQPGRTKGPRLQAASGQTASATKATVDQNVCGSDPPPPAVSGNAATSTVAAPPAIKMRRPADEAGRSASPVITWQAPVPASASVITHRSAAPSAASELIVPVTASKEPGCSPAASVQPPTSSTGATAEETKPHHGTLRTTTTIGELTENLGSRRRAHDAQERSPPASPRCPGRAATSPAPEPAPRAEPSPASPSSSRTSTRPPSAGPDRRSTPAPRARTRW